MEAEAYRVMYEVEENHWWFVGRRAVIVSLLEQAGVLPPIPRDGWKALDVGCGTGRNLQILRDRGFAAGIDLSPEAIGFSRRYNVAHVALADFRKIPFADASFDLVTALDTLEHIEEDGEVLDEIKRVLKPGGTLFVFVPAFPGLWGPQDDISHHVRRYVRPELETKIRAAGFDLKRSGFANFFLFLPTWVGRKLLRLFKVRIQSENNLNFSLMNWVLTRMFASEAAFLRLLDFPFGVSLFALAKKPS